MRTAITFRRLLPMLAAALLALGIGGRAKLATAQGSTLQDGPAFFSGGGTVEPESPAAEPAAGGGRNPAISPLEAAPGNDTDWQPIPRHGSRGGGSEPPGWEVQGFEGAAAPGIGRLFPEQSPPPDDADPVIKIFHLQNAEAAASVKVLLEIFREPSIRLTFDARTNSILYRGQAEVGDAIEALLLRLDETTPVEAVRTVPDGGSILLGGGSKPSDGAPPRIDRSTYQAAERKAADLAGALREANAQPSSRRPRRSERAKLRQAVADAFAARQRMQQAQVRLLQQRLRRIEQQIKAREVLKEQIIDRRTEELLQPELQWEADGELGAAPAGTEIPNNPLSPSSQSPLTRLPTGPASGALEAELQLAQAELAVANQHLAHVSKLVEQGYAKATELEVARAQQQLAQAKVDRLQRTWDQVGQRGASRSAPRTFGPERRVVNVSRDGSIELDDDPVTLDELTARLTAAQRQDADLSVLVRADATGSFQHVLTVLNAVRAAGVAAPSIAVRTVYGDEPAAHEPLLPEGSPQSNRDTPPPEAPPTESGTAALALPADPAAGELARMQGTWDFEMHVVNGVPREIGESYVKIGGNVLTLENLSDYEGEFPPQLLISLKPDKHEIDLTVVLEDGDHVWQGLYQWKDSGLRLYLSDERRPPGFVHGVGTGISYWQLKPRPNAKESSPEAADNQSEAESAADVIARMQGEWELVKEVYDGKPASANRGYVPDDLSPPAGGPYNEPALGLTPPTTTPPADYASPDNRNPPTTTVAQPPTYFKIEGNTMSYVRRPDEDYPPTWTFSLDPEQNHIELTMFTTEGDQQLLGLYRWVGPRLQMFLSTRRPPGFVHGRGMGIHFWELQRKTGPDEAAGETGAEP